MVHLLRLPATCLSPTAPPPAAVWELPGKQAFKPNITLSLRTLSGTRWIGGRDDQLARRVWWTRIGSKWQEKTGWTYTGQGQDEDCDHNCVDSHLLKARWVLEDLPTQLTLMYFHPFCISHIYTIDSIDNMLDGSYLNVLKLPSSENTNTNTIRWGAWVLRLPRAGR